MAVRLKGAKIRVVRQFRDVAKKWTFGFLNRKMLIISDLRFFVFWAQNNVF